MNPNASSGQQPAVEPPQALPTPEVHTTSTESPQATVYPAQNIASIPKKHSTIKIVLLVVGIIVCLPILGILAIIAMFVGYGVSHGHELKQLEKETTSLFSHATFSLTSRDCHDVELRNQCYFTVSASSNTFDSYLKQQGFTKSGGDYIVYHKDNLYIENTGSEKSYASYHKND